MARPIRVWISCPHCRSGFPVEKREYPNGTSCAACGGHIAGLTFVDGKVIAEVCVEVATYGRGDYGSGLVPCRGCGSIQPKSGCTRTGCPGELRNENGPLPLCRHRLSGPHPIGHPWPSKAKVCNGPFLKPGGARGR